MSRLIIILCLLSISLGVKAHQPDLSSTMLVEQSKNEWVLQIRAALTAFEYEVEQHYGANAYSSPEEFQDLVIDHLQDNLSIMFNGAKPLVLQNGFAKLGHETTVTFEVLGTPDHIQHLTVKNSSFNDISRNQSALIVIKKGFDKNQFTLNNDNDHTVKLELNNSKFGLVVPIKGNTKYYLLLSAGIFLSMFLIYFLLNKKTNAFSLSS